MSIKEDKENPSTPKSNLTPKKKKGKEKKTEVPECRINPLLGPLQRNQGPNQPERKK